MKFLAALAAICCFSFSTSIARAQPAGPMGPPIAPALKLVASIDKEKGRITLIETAVKIVPQIREVVKIKDGQEEIFDATFAVGAVNRSHLAQCLDPGPQTVAVNSKILSVHLRPAQS